MKGKQKEKIRKKTTIKNKKLRMKKFILSITIILLISIMLINNSYVKLISNNIINTIKAASQNQKTKGAYLTSDTTTMDSYKEKLLSDEWGSRYAGRIWSDKSVTKENVTLDNETDGYVGTVANSSDFLHTFSVLGSSQKFTGQIPTNLVIVIDNSGSMYSDADGNSSTHTWSGPKGTRMAKTVESVNKAIDLVMENNPQNQVAVILFGDGKDSTINGKGNNDSTDNTAKVIMPMKRYNYKQGEGNLEYISAGWPGGTPQAPNHTSNSGSGYVYVNKEICQTGTGYDSYQNGTTNIDAGIYLGMKTLIDVPERTFKIGDITVNRMPALIVLTDGAATDMLQGVWSNPLAESEILKQMAFANDFGDKRTALVEEWTTNGGTSYTYTWNMFLERVGNQIRQVGYGDGKTSQGALKADGNPGEAGKNALINMAKEYRATQGTLMLSTLMRAAYMKAAVEKTYNGDCQVYTISVDMIDPEEIKLPEGTIGNSNEEKITTNQAMMNPKYFSKEWLKEKGYINQTENLTEESTIYETYTAGSETVLGIVDAIDAWEEWKNDKTNFTSRNKVGEYRNIQEIKGLWKQMREQTTATFTDTKTKQQVTLDVVKPIGPSHDNAYYVAEKYTVQFPNLNKNDEINNPYGLTDDDIDINYVDKAYYASSAAEATGTIEEAFEKIMTELDNRPFTPIGGTNDADVKDSVIYTDPIGQYMEVKGKSITADGSTSDMKILLYGEMHSIVRTAVYDYSFMNSHRGDTYDQPVGEFHMGWYRKDGTYIGTEGGDWLNGDKYYLDTATARTFVPTLPDTGLTEQQAHTLYTFYRFEESTGERGKCRWNPSYGEQPSEDLEELYNKKYPGVFKYSDIRIWVEDTGDFHDETGDGMIEDTGYDEALYIHIPITVLPLQTAEIEIGTSGVTNYTTNLSDKRVSTPLRIFYGVGVSDDIITDGDVNLTLLSEEYINQHKDQETDRIYFYSNYYTAQDYDGDGIKDTTYGNTITTFTPSTGNRFYYFQNNLVVYKTSSGGTGTSGQGELVSTGGTIRLSEPVTNINDIDKKATYYVPIDYYKIENGKPKAVKYAVIHKGAEFFGKDENYLTYYDEATGKEVEAPGPGIVVATRVGGKRVGDLDKFAEKKSTNETNTADYAYVPTYGTTSNGFVIHLGNNGRLSLDDSVFIIGKLVENEYKTVETPTDEDFTYKLTMKGRTGRYGAIEAEWNGEQWVSVIDKIVALTDNQGFLLKIDGSSSTYYAGAVEEEILLNEDKTITVREGGESGAEKKVPAYDDDGNALYQLRTSYKNLEVDFGDNGTATITLNHKKGLIFNGLRSGVAYTTVEELGEEQRLDGYTFKQVEIIEGTESVKTNNKTTEISGTITAGTTEQVVYTNHLVPKVDISIEKKWENVTEDVKPETVKIVLSAENAEIPPEVQTQIELKQDTEWKYKWEHLEKCKTDGEVIKYKLEEQLPENFERVYKVETIEDPFLTHLNYEITNTYEKSKDTISITVKKNWEDDENTPLKRPNNLKITVMNGEQEEATELANEANHWTVEFKLPKYDKIGNEIKTYSIKEEAEHDGELFFYGDQKIGSIEATEKPDSYTVDITNKFVVPEETVKVTAKKIWQGDEVALYKRPQNIKIHLMSSEQEEPLQTKMANEENGWQVEFDELQKYNNLGDIIEYTVKEEEEHKGELDFYEQESIKETTENNFEITNKFNPNTDIKINITVEKIWEDSGDKAGKRPKELKINLMKNTDKAETEIANQGNAWKVSFNNLAKYDESYNEIKYSIQEEGTGNDLYFYKQTKIEEEPKYNYKITNEFNVPDDRISVTAEKIWEDSDDTAHKRPENLKIVLLKNGAEETTLVANEANSWKVSFDNLKKYDDLGNEIEYKVKEEENEANDLFFYEKSEPVEEGENNFKITNTFKVPKIKVKVTAQKVWEDGVSNGNKKPASIRIKLLKNGSEESSQLANTDNSWKVEFDELDKYDKNGDEIEYSVEEVAVADNDLYFYQQEAVQNLGNYNFKIVNKFNVPDDRITVSVQKIWEDSDDAANKRPENLKIVLLKNGKEETSLLANETNGWAVSFNDLKKYDEVGNEINYKVKEEGNEVNDLFFYEKSDPVEEGEHHFKITNTFKVPEIKVKVTAQKVWEDEASNGNRRPTSIIIKLLKNGAEGSSQLANTDNSWKVEFDELDKYDKNGDEIEYSVEEVAVADNDLYFYQQEAVQNLGNYNFKIVNKFNVPDDRITVSVQKIWEDSDDAANKRPENLKIVLLKNGKEETSLLANEENGWAVSFNDLKKYDEVGNEINYKVKEEENEVNDLFFYEKSDPVEEGEHHFKITNTFKVPEIKVKVTAQKVWEDEASNGNRRPTSIRIKLLKNGAEESSQLANTDNSWKVEFDELDKYDKNGDEIEYSVEEVAVADNDLYFYQQEAVQDLGDYNFKIVNKFNVPDDRITVSVQKIWEDSDDDANKRPENLKIVLLKNGAEETTLVANEANGWKVSFNDLKKYDEVGNEIDYKVKEEENEVNDLFFYEKSEPVEEGENNFKITNTFKVPEIKVKVTAQKVWEDEVSNGNRRPASIRIKLLKNGSEESSQLANTDNSWKVEFNELDKYDKNGDEIEYSVEEVAVADNDLYFYQQEAVQNLGNYNFKIVNKFNVPDDRIAVSVQKVWEDSNDDANKRPENLKIILLKNGKEESSLLANETNGWEVVFNDLKKYDEVGNEIEYKVKEEENEKDDLLFYEKSEPVEEGEHHFKITNTFKVPEIKVKVTAQKVWEDEGSNGNRRPASIKIKLLKNGIEESSQLANSANNWKVVFNELDKYDKNGDEIEYFVEEATVESNDLYFYQQEAVQKLDDYNFKIVNKFNVPDDRITVSVQKVWEDENNLLQKRPESVTIKLMVGDTEIDRDEANEANNWKVTFENQKKYDKYGYTINYTAQEEENSIFYKQIGNTKNENNEIVITNKFVIPDEKVSVKVNKIWNDNNNTAQKRPSSIKIELLRVEPAINGAEGSKKLLDTYILDTNKEQSHTFVNLPKYNNLADEIVYMVEEKETNENELYFYAKEITENSKNDYTITNTFTVPEDKTIVTARKVWNDEENRANKRPGNIIFKVIRDGKELARDVANLANDWTVKFELLKYDELGNKIKYEIEETEVRENDLLFYEQESIQEVEDNNFEITNIFKVPNDTITIKVKKAWQDNNNKNKTRPESIIASLKSSDGKTYEKIMTEKNADKQNPDNWIIEFEVPKYDGNGDEVKYTLNEQEAKDGDLKAYIIDVNGMTITNSLIIKDTNITKKATQIINSADDIIKYNIDYKLDINENYDKIVNITIIDNLPYKINTDREYDLNGGVYNATDKTITWEGTYNPNDQIITWKNSSGNSTEVLGENKTIHKEILVSYKSIDIKDAQKITNNVKGIIALENGVQSTNSAKASTSTDFLVDVFVRKVWQGDKIIGEDGKVISYRPSEITVQLNIPTSSDPKTEKVVLNDKNNWKYTWEDLPKYDLQTGEEINYTVEEIGVPKGYYVSSIKQNELKKTNVYDYTIVNSKYGSITITKVDSKDENKKLGGAEFKLEKLKLVNDKLVVDESFKPIIKTTSSEEETLGTVEFTELEYGVYRLTETKSPKGYSLLKNSVNIEIANGCKDYKGTISNKEGIMFPQTGGIGSILLFVFGTSIILVAIRMIKTTKKSLNGKHSRK